MNSFQVHVRVFNPRDPERTRAVDTTVDPEATIAVIPRSLGEDLDIPILWTHEFDDADEVEGVREVGVAGFSYGERKSPSELVILGERDDRPRLGPDIAEDLGLVRIERLGECPNCGTIDAIPILYGLPAPEAIQAAERGKIALGGCVVLPGNPRYACPNCGFGLPELAAVIYAAES